MAQGTRCPTLFSFSSSAIGWDRMSTSRQLQETQKRLYSPEDTRNTTTTRLAVWWGERVNQGAYLGVRISLYWSFSTRVVAATDMGITMLLMSNELSPRRLLMGCCIGREEDNLAQPSC